MGMQPVQFHHDPGDAPWTHEWRHPNGSFHRRQFDKFICTRGGYTAFACPQGAAITELST